MRRKRVESFYNNNRVSDRLKWLRKQSGISIRDVEKLVGIPKSSYMQMESDSRTTIYEYLFVLAVYYSVFWRKQYKETFPSFEGKQVKEISLEWIMFGQSATFEKYLKKINEIEKDFTYKHIEMLERQVDLEEIIRRFENGNNDTREHRDEQREGELN